MQDGNRLRIWTRAVVLLGAALLGASMLRSQPAGLDLAVTERGLSFELKAAFIMIAFDIGQKCSNSNSCGRLF